ncbi:hippurate hydrolase [Flavobacterium sp. 103]|uniref:amidohydrolase n=1 Tax=Flavobacterium sp. 103 TaxID=2135624 RepID=UPI000D5D22CC|nr:amidohydrolase [Flavobacterium sp. 103]PVX46804.1 hippurate hydrolase [Flavobacterium sp. 103]
MKNNKTFFLSILLLLLIENAIVAQSNISNPELNKLVDTDTKRLVEMFKDIHANPELGFMEVRTAAIVAKELKALGFEVKTGIGKTGVVGVLKNGNGPVVMYRADMDCNSVQETTGVAYANNKLVKNRAGEDVPAMHACGHDAHTIWMLGIAKAMVALKKSWSGTLVMVGQPAEELGEGAEAMINDKMYEKGVPVPDYLFGMHTAPFPVGYISNGSGKRMAGMDVLDVTFYGIGGHGSSPHVAKDPILMGAAAVIEYQTIISRAIDPQNAAVITVGSFQSGIDNNVIPGSALLKLNLRWFNEQDRILMLNGIKRINESIAFAYDLPKELYPTLTMKGMAYPLVNNEVMVDKVNKALEAVIVPEKNIKNIPAVMGSEDFHHLVIHNPKPVYDYMLVGVANKDATEKAAKEGKMFPFFNHNSNFEVDLSSIPLGVTLGTTALLEIFKK